MTKFLGDLSTYRVGLGDRNRLNINC